MTANGDVKTNVLATSSLFVTKEEVKVEILPPKPFVKSLDTTGRLTIGFDQRMKIPKSLKQLNDQKVALRWLQSSNNYYNETYLTPEGFRDFEIRPAVDLSLETSLESDYPDQQFTYEIVDF